MEKNSFLIVKIGLVEIFLTEKLFKKTQVRKIMIQTKPTNLDQF